MDNQSGNIKGKWSQAILLSIWAAVTLAFLILYVTDLRLSYDLLASPCTGPDCHYQAITPAEAAVLENANLAVELYALYMLGTSVFTVALYLVLALLLLKRLFPQWSGILLSLLLAIIPLAAITSFDVVAEAYPEWSAAIIFLFAMGSAMMVLFFLVFPNGRLLPRWSLLLPVIWALASTSDLVRDMDLNFGVSRDALSTIILGTLVAILFVISYRYRRLFNRPERQQAKWALYGILILMLGIPVWGYTFEWSQPAPGQARLLTTLLGWTISQLLLLAVPFTIVIAILRYRLWDIDLIIRKTLVYGTVTAFLVAIYFGSVVLLQNLLTNITGQSSPVAIVISTLVIAGLFNPVRQGVQRLIDRRFYRQKYNAARTLETFAQTARDEVDLDELSLAIVQLVQDTMRPESVSLWLKEVGEGQE